MLSRTIFVILFLYLFITNCTFDNGSKEISTGGRDDKRSNAVYTEGRNFKMESSSIVASRNFSLTLPVHQSGPEYLK